MTASTPAASGRLPATLALTGDERLARLVKAGNERAFVALYSRYQQQLYRYCRSMLRDDADAQDALQATFAGAFSALRQGRRDAPLRPWLYRIAHNESVSLLRRRRPHEQLGNPSEGACASAEDQAAGRERLAQLVADLQELPDRQRGALVMRELSGLTHEQIALALGTSVGAAKQTIFEARRSLLEFAEGRAMSCEEVCRILSDGDRRALRGRRVRAHVRDCAGCSAFAAAIPARRAELNALAPPLAAPVAGGLLAGMLARESGRGVGAGTVAGAGGKAAGLALATKAAVGVTLLATATVGVSKVLPHGSRASVPAHAMPASTHRAASSANAAHATSPRASPRGGSAPVAATGTHAVGPSRAGSLRPASAGGERGAATGLVHRAARGGASAGNGHAAPRGGWDAPIVRRRRRRAPTAAGVQGRQGLRGRHGTRAPRPRSGAPRRTRVPARRRAATRPHRPRERRRTNLPGVPRRTKRRGVPARRSGVPPDFRAARALRPMRKANPPRGGNAKPGA